MRSLRVKSTYPHILYVDDNEDHLFLVKEKIKNHGKKVRLFVEQDSEKVLERVQLNSFDLILLDYHLGSGLNGLEVLKLLRSKGIQCPIVMLTGQGDEQIAAKAIQSGAQEYFCKSSKDIDDLLLLVESYFI